MTKAQQKRLVNWRLKVLRHEREVTQNISARAATSEFRDPGSIRGVLGALPTVRRASAGTTCAASTASRWQQQPYTASSSGTAWRVCRPTRSTGFADEVIKRLPFRIYVVQTDNGAEFQSKFHWHLGELGIRRVYIRPRTPRLNVRGGAE